MVKEFFKENKIEINFLMTEFNNWRTFLKGAISKEYIICYIAQAFVKTVTEKVLSNKI